MTLSNYQFALDETFVMGPDTDYIVESWDGFGMPGMRDSDDPIPLQHGSWSGSDYLDSRHITLDIRVRGTSADDVVTNLSALMLAWYLDSTTDGFGARRVLSVQLPGQVTRQVYGRPRGADVSPNTLVSHYANVTLRFVALDPLWYATDLSTATLNLASPASGFSFNKSFDFGFGGGDSGVTTVVNTGSFPVAPSIRIDGPVTNPVITNETSGEALTLLLTIASGDYVIVDFVERTVLLNGTTSRFYAKTGTWWQLAAGSNSVRYGAASYTGTPTATLSWRDAWL